MYTDAEISGTKEADLTFYVWDGDKWEEIETTVYVDNNTLMATLPHLSFFAVGEIEADEDEDNNFLMLLVIIAILAVLVGALAKIFSSRAAGEGAEELIDFKDRRY